MNTNLTNAIKFVKSINFDLIFDVNEFDTTLEEIFKKFELSTEDEKIINGLLIDYINDFHMYENLKDINDISIIEDDKLPFNFGNVDNFNETLQINEISIIEGNENSLLYVNDITL